MATSKDRRLDFLMCRALDLSDPVKCLSFDRLRVGLRLRTHKRCPWRSYPKQLHRPVLLPNRSPPHPSSSLENHRDSSANVRTLRSRTPQAADVPESNDTARARAFVSSNR